MATNKPPHPDHVQGTLKGEELTLIKGKEPGRGGAGFYRTERDSTGIDPKARKPIDPAMPNLPPS
jgi:hypothetical protein